MTDHWEPNDEPQDVKDGLRAIRGIMLAVVLSIPLWIVVGCLVLALRGEW